ncbi:hypothetical protein OJ253_1996 [Cryptosporidium canis]|uniref:Serine aminopeptidase S33 domain-containing protein n=1 Tax=Cryptosporidium canis TaxID=195482 RepID=A0A9D5HXF2_9CRYT|nr:hypothetical protein OJ253_1996 [Cryptosporidium canis]
MDGQFVDEHSVSPSDYCKSKEFSSTKFKSETSGLVQCYHHFKVEPSQSRKGTAIFVHGYSSHTLAEYLNIVENQDSRQSQEAGLESCHAVSNPFHESKFVTSYGGSYIEYFNKKGYDVISLDLEGHGFSQGLKCNTEDLDNNCYNIIQMLKTELLKNSSNKNGLEKHQVRSFTWNKKSTEDSRSKSDEKSKNDKENEFFLYSSKIHKVNLKDTPGSSRAKACTHCSELECRFKETFGEKVIVCGISMGGAIALRLAELIGQTCETESSQGFSDKAFIKCLRSRMVCTVLLSPMLSLESVKKKTLNRILLPLLSIASYLFPNLQVGTRVHNPVCDHISSFSKYDPLYYSKRVKALMCRSLLNLTDTIRDNLHHYPIEVPLLICHCVHDTMTDFEGSERTIGYFTQILQEARQCEPNESHLISEFVLWPITCENMWHVLTRESGFQDLLVKILDWVSKKEASHERRHRSMKRSAKSPVSLEPFLRSPKSGTTLLSNRDIQVPS